MSNQTGRLQGNRVKQLREKRGWSQTDLGALLGGLDARQVLRLEKEESDPSSKTVAALAFHLETTADYLLGLTSDPSPKVINADLTEDEREVILAMRRDKKTRQAIQSVAALSQKG